MRKSFFILLLTLFLLTGVVFAQEEPVIVKPTEADPIIVKPTDGVIPTISLVNREVTATPVVIQLVTTPVPTQSTVRIVDRSVYENQPKSVVLPNAKESFDSGLEVPRPDLDQPINDPWDDLKQGYACEAILNRPYYFEKMTFGQEFTLDVTFRNVGTQTWDFNIDLMQYTGDQLEKFPGENVYDIWKDVGSDDKNTHIVKPGQSIRVTVPMRAPSSPYHEDNKYYAAYTLVRNWNVYGWDALHDGQWDRMDGNALFCPVYFYIYVPD